MLGNYVPRYKSQRKFIHQLVPISSVDEILFTLFPNNVA